MWIRFVVTLAILIPAMLLVGGGSPLVTFGIAVIAFGTGRVVEWAFATPADAPVVSAPPSRVWLIALGTVVVLGLVGYAVLQGRLTSERATAAEAIAAGHQAAVLARMGTRVEVTVASDGTALIAGVAFDDAALAAGFAASRPGTTVRVSLSPGAPNERQVQVMDLASKAGLSVTMGP